MLHFILDGVLRLKCENYLSSRHKVALGENVLLPIFNTWEQELPALYLPELKLNFFSEFEFIWE